METTQNTSSIKLDKLATAVEKVLNAEQGPFDEFIRQLNALKLTFKAVTKKK
jgi:hypothetical protein